MNEIERRRRSGIPESAEVVRISIPTGETGVESRKVVLEIRPAAEDARDAETLARWIETSLGYVAEVAGYGAGEVTHVRLWRDGAMVEVALEDLLAADRGGNEGDGVVHVPSERVCALEERHEEDRAEYAARHRGLPWE
jgi:hypothetical protein